MSLRATETTLRRGLRNRLVEVPRLVDKHTIGRTQVGRKEVVPLAVAAVAAVAVVGRLRL